MGQVTSSEEDRLRYQREDGDPGHEGDHEDRREEIGDVGQVQQKELGNHDHRQATLGDHEDQESCDHQAKEDEAERRMEVEDHEHQGEDHGDDQVDGA